MPLDVMRTIASVGSSMIGSGTLSTRTSRLPCQATAFMGSPRVRVLSDPYPRREAQTLGARVRPGLGPGEDLRHHVALGARVVVRGVPFLARKLALGRLVEAAVVGVVAQP